MVAVEFVDGPGFAEEHRSRHTDEEQCSLVPSGLFCPSVLRCDP